MTIRVLKVCSAKIDRLWTWGEGRAIGYRRGDELRIYEGHHIGQFIDNEVYAYNGSYLGEILHGRLISKESKADTKIKPFRPKPKLPSRNKPPKKSRKVKKTGYIEFPRVLLVSS